MPHPNDRVLGNAGTVVIDSNHGAFVAPSGRIIHAIRNTHTAASNFTVKGHDIYEYVAANSGGGSYYGGPDAPADEVEDNGLLKSTHAAGYYRAKETVAITISLASQETVYGKFTSVDATANDSAVLYLGNRPRSYADS